jgi:hypothetical protein
VFGIAYVIQKATVANIAVHLGRIDLVEKRFTFFDNSWNGPRMSKFDLRLRLRNNRWWLTLAIIWVAGRQDAGD